MCARVRRKNLSILRSISRTHRRICKRYPSYPWRTFLTLRLSLERDEQNFVYWWKIFELTPSGITEWCDKFVSQQDVGTVSTTPTPWPITEIYRMHVTLDTYNVEYTSPAALLIDDIIIGFVFAMWNSFASFSAIQFNIPREAYALVGSF